MTNSPTRYYIVLVLLAIVALHVQSVRSAERFQVDWIRQHGSIRIDEGLAVAIDGFGGAYLAGFTRGSLGGPEELTGDAFLSRYDAAGNLLWTRQPSTIEEDVGFGVVRDLFGGAYIAGNTGEALGGPYLGGSDSFVSHYDSNGNSLWSRQVGTSGYEYTSGAAADGVGGVYITGTSSFGGTNPNRDDAFVTHFDAAGNMLWSRQFGSPENELCHSISADEYNGIYVTGKTAGALDGPQQGGFDAFVSRFDTLGNLLWTRQFGTTGHDRGEDVAPDGQGGAYVVGFTNGNEPGSGTADGILSRYDVNGNLVWTQSLGGRDLENDRTWDVASDDRGGVFLAGTTTGAVGGPNAGREDVFISHYDALGNLVSAGQIGSSGRDIGYDLVVDPSGAIYLAGVTSGNLGGLNQNSWDPFIARVITVPEPSTLTLCLMGLGGWIGIAVRLTVVRRRLSGIVTAVAILIASSVPASAAPIEWPIAAGGNGHFYELIVRDVGPVGWHEALNEAASMRWMGSVGHLATLTSASETEFIYTHFRNSPVSYIGAFQDSNAPDYSEPAGGWRWVTGEPWVYTNWLQNEPNNAPGYGPEDYVVIHGDEIDNRRWQWNDNHDAALSGITEFEGFLVEFPTPVPEPSTVALCLMGLGWWIGIAVRRKRRQRTSIEFS